MGRGWLALALALAACRGDPAQQGGSAGAGGQAGDLTDHGGPIMPASTISAIWWGAREAFPPDAIATVEAFLQGLRGSALLSLTDQYMRGSRATSSFSGSLFDGSAPPADPASGSVAAEICSVLQANGARPDGDTVYLVYASAAPHSRAKCAWHSWGNCGGTTIRFALMLNAWGTSCELVPHYSCAQMSAATLSVASFTAHELLETLTDPGGDAWADSTGAEIGDKCEAERGCTVVGGKSFEMQQEWSNALHGCALP